jgi:hypothetical protein
MLMRISLCGIGADLEMATADDKGQRKARRLEAAF